jgi:hypothetical protein
MIFLHRRSWPVVVGARVSTLDARLALGSAMLRQVMQTALERLEALGQHFPPGVQWAPPNPLLRVVPARAGPVRQLLEGECKSLKAQWFDSPRLQVV